MDSAEQDFNIALFRKVWALIDSPDAGEAGSARFQARRMLAAAGLRWADGARIARLGEVPPRPAAPSPQPQRQPQPQPQPGNEDAWHWASATPPPRPEPAAPDPARDAVLALTHRESLIHAAVRPWAVYQPAPQARWIDHLAGWHGGIGDPPPEVAGAIARAYPLPTTITAAKAEAEEWAARHRELRAALVDEQSGEPSGDMGDIGLDLACGIRRDMVQALLMTDLRAQSAAELLIRQRSMMSYGLMLDEVEAALLRDLEHLAAQEAAALRTAGERRAAVEALLAQTATAPLSDREIARRCGVSPRTVATIRRQRGG